MRIRLSVSPDADDLFMVRALLAGAIDTRGDSYVVDTHPTDALNRLATDPDPPEVLAMSVAHWPVAASRYALLTSGCSMGEGYGPVVVAPRDRPLASLEGQMGKWPRMDRDLLQRYGSGLIATTGCPSGEVQTRLRLGQWDEAVRAAGCETPIVLSGVIA